MSNIEFSFGQLDTAKLNQSEFEKQLWAKCVQLKRVKLYLASRSIRRMPLGGRHLGGTWTKPVTQ